MGAAGTHCRLHTADHHGEQRVGFWNTLTRKRREEVNHRENGSEILGGEAKIEDMAGGK